MVTLTNILANRCSVALQRPLTNSTGVVLRRFFSSQSPRNSYVGAPEYPTPGTKAYTESMERLHDPRVIEMLSMKKIEPLNSSEMNIQQWMKAISNQNAQLFREVSRLTDKVEKLESRLGGL